MWSRCFSQVYLLLEHSRRLVENAIYHASHREDAANYGTHPCQEVSEGALMFSELYHHWTEVVQEEHTYIIIYRHFTTEDRYHVHVCGYIKCGYIVMLDRLLACVYYSKRAQHACGYNNVKKRETPCTWIMVCTES